MRQHPVAFARYLRQHMIQTEVRLWSRLRRRQLGGWKFRRQHPIGPYIVDFYCPAARMVVEFNGASHEDEWHEVHDRRRQNWLEARGLQVLNLSYETEEVKLDDLVAAIEEALRRMAETTGPSVA